MPCLYSLKTMYRRLPFIILLSILAVFALRASVVAPSILVQNYSVDDYKASCQNWDLAVSYHGILYVANNSGLVTFDGNTWNTYPLPDKTPIYKVSFQNDSIYTQGKSSLGYWLYDKLGNLEYHPIDTLPSYINFDDPETNYTIPKEIEEKHPTSFASAGGLNFTGTSTSGIYITNDEEEIFQHLNINNQLQDNIVRSICVQDNNLIWVALDNGISQIDINPPIAMLGKRSQIGKLEDAVKEDNRLYIRTNVGYFSRSLMFGDKFTPISDEIGRSYIHPDTTDNHLSVSSLFKNKDVLSVFANAESIYPVPDNLYWLTIQNEAGLFHRENGTGTLKCRILFDNYDLNLVTNGKRIIPLNDSLDLVSAMQGTLLINTRQLIEGSLGGLTMPRFMRIEYQDQEGTHYLYPDTQRIDLPHNFQELSLYIGTTVFTPNHQISYKLEGVSADWSSWQKDGKITFVGTNTHRLAIKSLPYEGNEELSMIIPSKVLGEISRNLTGEVPQQVLISLLNNQIMVVIDNIVIVSRLIEGQFPDYRRVIPPKFALTSKVNIKELAGAVERVALFSTDGDYSIIKMSVAADEITITSSSPDVGTGLEVVSCQTIGDPLNVAFNAKYILDILKNLEAEEAVLSMNTSLSPVCVTCADEPDYTYIVTPVRVVF